MVGAKSTLSLLWVGNILVILGLSLKGRALQYWLQDQVSLTWVGYVVTGILAGIVLFLVLRSLKNGMGLKIIPAALFAGALLILTLNMKNPEEKVHLVLFGSLGFMGLRLFGFWKGLVICLALAGLDELLQLYLPSRVGDFHDVGLNSVAAVAGVGLSGLSFKGQGSRK